MIELTLDFETRSRLDLGETSAYKYAAHPSTVVLCAGVGAGDSRGLWLPGMPFPFADKWPDIVLNAHNAEFEYCIWNFCCRRLYGWPELKPEQVQCTAARAAYAGLPRKLADLTKPLGLGDCAKDKEGHRVMLRLTKPVGAQVIGCSHVGGMFDDDPGRHGKVQAYCLQDVRAEMEVAKRCPPLPPIEQEIWLSNREINERGVPVDVGFCRAAAYLINRENARLARRLVEITGRDDVSVDCTQYLKDWMNAQGANLPDMQEGTVAAAVRGEIPVPPAALEVLQIRSLTSNKSTAKYQAFLNYSNADARCQGTHVYHKAGTGRYAGSGPQPQNLPRLDPDTLEDRLQLAEGLSHTSNPDAFYDQFVDRGGVVPTLAGMVRLAVQAKPGHVLVVRDWSAIEMRLIHWLAGDESTLTIIRDFDNGVGEEPYKIAAAMMYGKPASEVTKTERQQGKVMILGSGYCSGAATFQGFCAGYGIDMPLDRAKEIIQLYRRSYPLVKRLWYKLQDAALAAVDNPGKSYPCGYINYYMKGKSLCARLPSGREISYYDAQIGKGAFGPEIHCVNPKGGNRMSVGMPTIVNNVDQGTGRDLLVTAQLKCRAEGLPVVLHVHDELVCEVPEADADRTLAALKDIMGDVPRWAAGLPIKTDGGYSSRYTK